MFKKTQHAKINNNEKIVSVRSVLRCTKYNFDIGWRVMQFERWMPMMMLQILSHKTSISSCNNVCISTTDVSECR